jgi:hypothetical protein
MSNEIVVFDIEDSSQVKLEDDLFIIHKESSIELSILEMIKLLAKNEQTNSFLWGENKIPSILLKQILHYAHPIVNQIAEYKLVEGYKEHPNSIQIQYPIPIIGYVFSSNRKILIPPNISFWVVGIVVKKLIPHSVLFNHIFHNDPIFTNSKSLAYKRFQPYVKDVNNIPIYSYPIIQNMGVSRLVLAKSKESYKLIFDNNFEEQIKATLADIKNKRYIYNNSILCDSIYKIARTIDLPQNKDDYVYKPYTYKLHDIIKKLQHLMTHPITVDKNFPDLYTILDIDGLSDIYNAMLIHGDKSKIVDAMIQKKLAQKEHETYKLQQLQIQNLLNAQMIKRNNIVKEKFKTTYNKLKPSEKKVIDKLLTVDTTISDEDKSLINKFETALMLLDVNTLKSLDIEKHAQRLNICEHTLFVKSLIIEDYDNHQLRSLNSHTQRKNKLISKYSGAIENYTHYCKLCGQVIVEDIPEVITEFIGNKQVYTYEEDEFEIFIFKEVSHVINMTVVFNTAQNVKQVIKQIVRTIMPEIRNIEHNLLRIKTNINDNIKYILVIHIAIYTYAILIRMIVENKNALHFSLKKIKGGKQHNKPPRRNKQHGGESSVDQLLQNNIKAAIYLILTTKRAFFKSITLIKLENVKSLVIKAYQWATQLKKTTLQNNTYTDIRVSQALSSDQFKKYSDALMKKPSKHPLIKNLIQTSIKYENYFIENYEGISNHDLEKESMGAAIAYYNATGYFYTKPIIIVKKPYEVAQELNLSEYYDLSGYKRKWTMYVYEVDGKEEMYSIQDLKKLMFNDNNKYKSLGKVVDLFDGKQYRSKLKQTNKAIEDNITKLIADNTFFKYYEIRCPETGMHDLQNSKCVKCGYIVDGVSTEFRAKYYDDFYTIQSKVKKDFYEKLYDIKHIAESKVETVEYPPISINDTDILWWAKNSDTPFNILINIGLSEHVKYSAIEKNKLNPTVSITDFTNKAMKLKNYYMFCDRMCGILKYKESIPYIPYIFKDLVQSINSEKFPDSFIQKDFDDKWNYYIKIDPKQATYFIYEELISMMKKIDEISHDLFIILTTQIILSEKRMSKPSKFASKKDPSLIHSSSSSSDGDFETMSEVTVSSTESEIETDFGLENAAFEDLNNGNDDDED